MDYENAHSAQALTGDTSQMGELPVNDLAPHTPTVGIQPAAALRYDLSFTGTGSEYFKIWIVNLLLILVSLGIYYPWAKVRKAKYLHRNMMLDGTSFDYHASGGTMLKGTIIAGALYGVYHLVDSTRSWWVFSAFTLVMCVLLPWLLWKSMRFKLSVTSYRALPFSFKASLRESFSVFVPLVLYNAAFLAVAFYIGQQKTARASMATDQLRAFGIALAVFVLLIVLLYPLFYWMLKRFQHNHYQWTSLRTQFAASVTDIYKQWLLIVLPFVMFYGTIAMVVYVLASTKALFNTGIKLGNFGLGFIVVSVLVTYLVTLFIPVIFKALFIAKFQNLVWNTTTAQGIKFASTLKARSLVWLSFKNLFLIVVTFGIYWPFAFINVVKLRASSISVLAAAPIMHLAAQHAAADKERNAVGDAAGDLFDIDIAL